MAHRITLYDTLGVESDASEQDIRAAFRRLSLKNHPDRFRGGDREAAEERFQAITEAFNVLSRPESRENYDTELSMKPGGAAGGEGKLDAKEIARRLAAKGAEAYRGGSLQEGIEHLQLAIDHDDNADRAHYFMGFVLCQVPGRERDALRHLERAVALDPHNATYKGQAAVAAMGVGMNSRAERLAQDALALDPTNKKALAVLAKLGATGTRRRTVCSVGSGGRDEAGGGSSRHNIVLEVWGATDVGMKRRVNEDVFLVDEDLGVYLVADGMGGHAAGEVASRLAADEIMRSLSEHATLDNETWPEHWNMARSATANLLVDAILAGHDRVTRAVRPRLQPPGHGDHGRGRSAPAPQQDPHHLPRRRQPGLPSATGRA